MFDQEGKISQINYAVDAINNAGTAIGMLFDGGIALVCEKDTNETLLEVSRSSEKIFALDSHLFCIMSGMEADANYLIDKIRELCQWHRYNYRAAMPIDNVVQTVCGWKQNNTQRFQKKNKLLTIIRAHEPQCEGVKFHHWGKAGMPPVITQFSAPNYCDTYGNKAAIIKIKKGILEVQQYEFIGHPYFQPDNMDVFEWSQPFITQKIVDLFYHVSKLTEKNKNENQTIREEAKFEAQISSGTNSKNFF